MKHFSERNPSWIAAIGTVALVLIFVGVLFSDKLPIIGGGTTYRAEFAESAGLASGNEVRIAGVKVGKVNDVELDGDHVVVSFTVDDHWVGDRSTVSIELKTLLGQKYLSVDPQGDGDLDPDDMIPLDRTTVPFDMAEAVEGLGSRLQKIDVGQLEQSFTALSDAFEGTPKDVRVLLDGLSGLSRTVASRDDQLSSLVSNTRSVTGNLAGLTDEVDSIIDNGDSLLTELDARRDDIHNLLVGTRDLAEQVSGLVKENQKQLGPALEKLDRVTAILQRNKRNISQSLLYMKTYFTTLTDATGTGPWLDGYICGLFKGTRPDLSEGQVRDCNPGGGR